MSVYVFVTQFNEKVHPKQHFYTSVLSLNG